VHPNTLWREIALLVDHGMAPMEAIKAATSRAARVLGVDALVGSIAVGKQADLVAVEGSPLDDPSVLGRPSMVMRGGEVVIDRVVRWGGPRARSRVLDTSGGADHDTSDN
jgi:imidazolonepropionase-like amidohydrolase